LVRLPPIPPGFEISGKLLSEIIATWPALPDHAPLLVREMRRSRTPPSRWTDGPPITITTQVATALRSVTRDLGFRSAFQEWTGGHFPTARDYPLLLGLA